MLLVKLHDWSISCPLDRLSLIAILLFLGILVARGDAVQVYALDLCHTGGLPLSMLLLTHAILLFTFLCDGAERDRRLIRIVLVEQRISETLKLPNILVIYLFDDYGGTDAIHVIWNSILSLHFLLHLKFLLDLHILISISLFHYFVQYHGPDLGLTVQAVLARQRILLHFLEFVTQKYELVEKYIVRSCHALDICDELRRIGLAPVTLAVQHQHLVA